MLIKTDFSSISCSATPKKSVTDGKFDRKASDFADFFEFFDHDAPSVTSLPEKPNSTCILITKVRELFIKLKVLTDMTTFNSN